MKLIKLFYIYFEFYSFQNELKHKIMIENHHNLMIWEDGAKFIFSILLTTSSPTIFFFKDFFVFHLWFVLNVVKLSLVYCLMIKSSVIKKILIPKFFLIGELRAALMLLHRITNNHIINFIKVDDVVRCKGRQKQNTFALLVLQISICHS